MTLTVERIGDISLVTEFWECECPQNFVHRKVKPEDRKHPFYCCTSCASDDEDSPDARIENVIDDLKHAIEYNVLTEGETIEQLKAEINFLEAENAN